jgi:hypothetical protein
MSMNSILNSSAEVDKIPKGPVSTILVSQPKPQDKNSQY